MNELFLALGPDQVLTAVEALGLETTGHILPLHCYENRVYDLKLEGNEHVVAKFYRPARWSREAIREEHQFLLELQEAEVPVCAPLVVDGETVFEVDEILYAVWPRTGGRAPAELDDDQLRVLGRLLARIHNVGAMHDAPHRPRLDRDRYIREPVKMLQSGPFLPPQWSGRYAAAAERLGDAFESAAQDVPRHRIHGDCHLGNLLHGRDGWFFLDFDDMLEGPAVQDLWMLVPERSAEGERQREVFLEGYRQFRDFESKWLRLVEPLRGLRYVYYASWLARRWSDPAFPNSFPHFNTEAYWERETIDLEGQATRAERAVSGLEASLGAQDPWAGRH